nr:glycerol-3-phosphate dehydrogenase C-terminal domain-containing protein [Cellulosimicrobium sp. MM]
MAKDAVDFAIGQRASALPSITHKIPLLGAVGLDAVRRQARPWASRYGWTPAMVDHLLHRYGSNLRELVELCEAQPDLARPLEHAPAYLRAEVAYGVSPRGALHLEDLLLHRTRLNYEVPDRGLAALPEIAAVAAEILGWDDATRDAEIASYTARAEAEAAAEQEPDDASAERTRLEAPDVSRSSRSARPDKLHIAASEPRGCRPTGRPPGPRTPTPRGATPTADRPEDPALRCAGTVETEKSTTKERARWINSS